MIAVRAMEGDHRGSRRRISAGFSTGQKGRKGTDLPCGAGRSEGAMGERPRAERSRETLMGCGQVVRAKERARGCGLQARWAAVSLAVVLAGRAGRCHSGPRREREWVNLGRAGRGGCWARVRGKVGGLGCWFWAVEKGSGPWAGLMLCWVGVEF